MVEDLINAEAIKNTAASAGSATLDVILWLAVAGLIVAGIFLLLEFMKYKHLVRLRFLTKEGSFILDDKAKRKEEDGVIYWSLLKQKLNITPPPKEAINITKKGRLVAECYITEDNPEPVWLLDKGYSDAQEGFKPLTTQQRSLTVSRIRKAQARIQKSMWETMTQIIMPIAMVVIIAIPFIFWGDITKESTEAMSKAGEVAKQNAEVAAQNARLLSVMAGKLEAGDLTIKQNIPPDAVNEGGVN